jgi:hypothetical protein
MSGISMNNDARKLMPEMLEVTRLPPLFPSDRTYHPMIKDDNLILCILHGKLIRRDAKYAMAFLE